MLFMKNRIFYLPVLLVLALLTAGLLLGCPSPVNNVEDTEYTVTFMPNGADGGTVPAPITRTVGTEITIPGNTGALTLANHYFDGWNTQADGEGTPFPADKQHTLIADLTLYAQWLPGTPPQYTITFMPNGADGGTVPNPITGVHGSLQTIPGNTGALTLANHNFDGWNTAVNGSGTAFAANAQHTLVANLTLYAQWQPVGNQFTITFFANEATAGHAPSPISGAPGTVVSIPGNTYDLLRDEHHWFGWNTQPDGLGETIVGLHTLTGNLNLYARWIWDCPDHFLSRRITFFGNENTGGLPPNFIHVPFGTTVEIPTNSRGLVRTGYRFDGWNTAQDGTGTSFVPLTEHQMSVHLNLYAQWVTGTEDLFSVTMFPNGGTPNTPVALPHLQNRPRGYVFNIPGLPPGIEKVGYVFTGWNTLPDGSGTAFIWNPPPPEPHRHILFADLNLYAQWGEAVRITFNLNGGTGTTPSDLWGPAGATRTIWDNWGITHPGGLTFTTWNTAADGSGRSYAFNQNVTLTESFTLFADWEAPAGFLKVVTGTMDHNLAITLDGALYAWGAHGHGRTGLGLSEGFTATPTRVGTFTDWVFIAAGEGHSFGIREDGTLWAWGNAANGRLGRGTDATMYTVPAQVGTFTDWVYVAAGSSHSLGIRSDGSLWAWGSNESGRTGRGTTSGNTTAPYLVCDDHVWTSVAASLFVSFGIRDDNSLWAWGDSWMGPIGIDTDIDVTTPTRIGTDNNWRSVSTAFSHTLAVRTTGALYAWGQRTQGQLGIGGALFGTVATPTRVGDANNWASVSAGENHSLGVRTDGTLYAWGNNVSGRTGLGMTAGAQTEPERVAGTGWTFVSASMSHSVGKRTDGTVWAWGNKDGGRTTFVAPPNFQQYPRLIIF